MIVSRASIPAMRNLKTQRKKGGGEVRERERERAGKSCTYTSVAISLNPVLKSCLSVLFEVECFGQSDFTLMCILVRF